MMIIVAFWLKPLVCLMLIVIIIFLVIMVIALILTNMSFTAALV